ncbi:MAG: L-lactate dehydrogenase (cytochrome) [Mariniblastus sp.]|jgi:L-lactate dehydrogenase (cytochrome)
MPSSLNLKALGQFMNQTFEGRIDEDKSGLIRDKWKGKLVLKGVVNEADCEKAKRLGVDGIIVSNHGGRQLDAGQSTIVPMTKLAKQYGNKIEVMMKMQFQQVMEQLCCKRVEDFPQYLIP